MQPLSEDDLERYGFIKTVLRDKIIYSKTANGETLTCEFSLKSISHKIDGREASREEFFKKSL